MATFRRTYLETEFKKLNDRLPEHVDLYLIGGGAMSFQNLKVATKDIDVVSGQPENLNSPETHFYPWAISSPASG